MELVFVSQWPDHGDAVPIGEETLQEPPDPVLLLHTVGESLLALERLLEVVLRGDGLALSIDQLEGEVSNDPHERWEVLGILLWINIFLADAGALDLDMLGQVDHKREVLKGVLID